jgi:hypothetical protein
MNILGDGSFEVDVPQPDTYDVWVKASHWVARRITGIVVDGSTNIGTVVLRNGDIDGNNKVNAQDQILLRNAYGSIRGPTPSPNWNPNADLNGDLRVNSADLIVLRNNYGAVGDP